MAQGKLENNIKDRDRESTRLSSGDRIFRPAYDPSGLVISEGMRTRIRSFGQAERNANDSISLIQLAEGALSTVHSVGARMKELAIQSATDTYSDEERALIVNEFDNMKSEVSRILKTTTFNGKKVLDGSTHFDFQIGIHNEEGIDRVTYDLKKILKLVGRLSLSGASVATKQASFSSLPKIDKMLNELSRTRATLGSMQHRVNSIVTNLQHSQENTAAANSRIRDTNVAKAASEKVKADLKTGSAVQWLAKGNKMPERVYKLID